MDSVVGKVGIILQARMGSTRLPGKVLMPLPRGSDETILSQIILRTSKSKGIEDFIVATSNSTVDDPLDSYLKRKAIKCFRGSEDDVLERFVRAAEWAGISVVVRLTGDNPFVSSKVLNFLIESHLESEADYSTTSGLPIGTNIEVVNLEALQRIQKSSPSKEDKEHVTLFIRNNPKLFKISSLDFPSEFEAPLPRMTVDYASDYEFACKVFEELHKFNGLFELEDVAGLLREKPWITSINIENIQK